MKDILNLGQVRFILNMVMAIMLVGWFTIPMEDIDAFTKTIYSIVAVGYVIFGVKALVTKPKP